MEEKIRINPSLPSFSPAQVLALFFLAFTTGLVSHAFFKAKESLKLFLLIQALSTHAVSRDSAPGKGRSCLHPVQRHSDCKLKRGPWNHSKESASVPQGSLGTCTCCLLPASSGSTDMSRPVGNASCHHGKHQKYRKRKEMTKAAARLPTV